VDEYLEQSLRRRLDAMEVSLLMMERAHERLLNDVQSIDCSLLDICAVVQSQALVVARCLGEKESNGNS